MIKKITIIGAGNVATHLGKSFAINNYLINQVYSHSIENAKSLATEVSSEATNNIAELKADSDFYIICVKDDVINELIKRIPFKDKLIAHTSGSVSMDAFKENNFLNYGIFYPLQTFSKNKEVDLNKVPFCIEGANPTTEKELIGLAQQLTSKAYSISSEQRKVVHLAAVFACNFSNFMYTIADDITSKHNINFEILKPLILETAKKINNDSPFSMQTGPATRNDQEIIKNHIHMLADNKDYQDIYELITQSIIDKKS